MTGTRNIQERYDRFARVYDFFEYPIERFFFARIRRETLSSLKGKVLEIGVGTGKNLPYYNWENIKYTGIDFSKNILEMAKKKNVSKAKMIYMDAQDMDFKENSFDYIVTAFVLCSIPDPVKALK